MSAPTVLEVLDNHPLTWRAMTGRAVCEGCDWGRQNVRTRRDATLAHNEHVAAMLKPLTKRAEADREASRKALGRAWGAWLSLMVHERLEDGTRVIEAVLAADPALRERLARFL